MNISLHSFINLNITNFVVILGNITTIDIDFIQYVVGK